MAHEATIIELLGNRGNPIRFNCADGTTIPKGTLLKITDPRTVVAHSALNDPFAGIAAMEKVANDGSTSISVYTCGIFACWDAEEEPATGQRLRLGGEANSIRACDADRLLIATAGILIEKGDVGGDNNIVLIGSGL